jgi:8-oxo-dGTP pyrophosphatase MutT (NUDIX family)
VLLGEKLTGLGVGKFVGPGGKSEPGETAPETAVREVHEEVGLSVDPGHLVPIATISYPFVGRDHLSQRSFAFMTTAFRGTVKPSNELVATWWPLDEIPFHKMWPDAGIWLPRALGGEFVEATFTIGLNNEVLGHTLGSGPESS